jgi:predicted alpha/beta superfamily hydrolase
MRSIVFLLLFSTFFSQAQKPRPAAGTIVRFEQFPSKYVQPRTVDVWLPEGYDSTQKYAVLYMHDGQMLYDSTTTWNKQEWGVDETVSALLKQQKIRPTIVVGIWNNNKKRFAEYFPQKALQWISTADRKKQLSLSMDTALANQYLHFLVAELKPFIDSTFSTHRDQSNTFIAGSSMGGLISMYAVCEYPAVFAGAACLSTHWPGGYNKNDFIPNAFTQYLSYHLPNPSTHRFYFDYGDQTLDSLYEPYQLRIDSVAKVKGYRKKNWISGKFPGANHSEQAWAKRLAIPLLFLLAHQIKNHD